MSFRAQVLVWTVVNSLRQHLGVELLGHVGTQCNLLGTLQAVSTVAAPFCIPPPQPGQCGRDPFSTSLSAFIII